MHIIMQVNGLFHIKPHLGYVVHIMFGRAAVVCTHRGKEGLGLDV